MKKLILIIIIAFSLCGAGLVATVATYPVSVNGERLDATVLNHNGTTYIPLKAVGQALNAEVSWNGNGVEISTVDVAALKEACVMIYAYGDGMNSQGSAVYVDYSTVLTAYHTVDQDRNIIWDAADKTTTFSAINFDSNIDIATLQASREVKPVKIGDSDEVKEGDKVIVIGAPNDKADTVIYTTVKRLTSDIVIHGSTNGGSSGGGLFNQSGELVGIVAAGSDSENETYVIPINAIRKAL